MLRAILIVFLGLSLASATAAQDRVQDPAPTAPLEAGHLAPNAVAPGDPLPPTSARPTTGGAQTLDDILARQRGEKVDDSFRRSAVGVPGGGAGIAFPLGTLGGASDAEIFRQLRYGSASLTASNRGPAAGVVIQDGGMSWLQFRSGPLADYGAWALGIMLILLLLFFLLRGRIRIEGERTGRTVTRFSAFERFGHWLFAGSFLLLALTGLASLFGRKILIPAFGHEFFSDVAIGSKWVHNNVAWAFIVGLVIVIVNWTLHNLPNRHDLVWLAKGGGLFSKGVHPPARKFNAGQKIIFWACVILGLSISASGLSLLFPFDLPMFAKTFTILNDVGAPGWVGMAPLPETLTPQEEMQLAQAWHGIVAFVFIAIILAHIYLGTLGMEGAFDAMGSGEVDEQWAREHHGLWLKEIREKEARPAPASPAAPAE